MKHNFSKKNERREAARMRSVCLSTVSVKYRGVLILARRPK